MEDSSAIQLASIRQAIVRYRLNNGWPDYEPCRFCDSMAGFQLSDGDRAVYRCLESGTPFAVRRYPRIG